MEIYLVRHTKVGISRDYCYGISDVALADSHDADIKRVKNKLKDVQFTKSYTSPLSRCMALSVELADNAIEEEALLEMSLGDWELQKWKDIDQEALDNWMKDFVNISPPNSENYLEYSMKPVMFFDGLVNKHQQHEKILLVSHSGAIRTIICHVLNLSLAQAFSFEVDYGSVSKIEVIEGWYKLKYLNH